MKTQIILDQEDIKKIVAEKYKVDSDKVEVRCYWNIFSDAVTVEIRVVT